MKKRAFIDLFRGSGLACAALLVFLPIATPLHAEEGATVPLLERDWSFEGPLGRFDRAALRRGLQIYREVCASCHGLSFLYFRNLSEEGGLELSQSEVEALAAQYTIMDGPDREGDMFERKRKPSDRFPEPYENEQLARLSNNGALPPELSLITKARAGGVSYVYSLLLGYQDPPPHLTVEDGQYYNRFFQNTGGAFAMSPPLTEGIVEYEGEGAPKPTLRQMAHDVSLFLAWAASPAWKSASASAFR